MNWILDGLVAVIFIAVIIFNMKRGFVKSLILVVGFVISVMISISISGYLAPVVYDNFLSSKISDKITSEIADYDVVTVIKENLFEKELGVEIEDEEIRNALQSGDVTENLIGLCQGFESQLDEEKCREEINGFLENSDILDKEFSGKSGSIIKSYLTDNKDKINTTVNTLAIKDKTERTQSVEKLIVKPAIVSIIRVIIAVIIFMILSIIVRVIAKSADIVKRIPLAGSINSFLGGAIGFIEAIVLLYALALLVKIYLTLGLGTGNILNIDNINKTILFQIFYNIH